LIWGVKKIDNIAGLKMKNNIFKVTTDVNSHVSYRFFLIKDNRHILIFLAEILSQNFISFLYKCDLQIYEINERKPQNLTPTSDFYTTIFSTLKDIEPII